MPRRRQHAPLRVYLNNRHVGHLLKEPGGAVSFRYDENWLAWDNAIPVSLSLPLRDDAYRGAPVTAVFDNLLPDSDALRRRVAERVGAEGADAYSLLAAIGIILASCRLCKCAQRAKHLRRFQQSATLLYHIILLTP